MFLLIVSNALCSYHIYGMATGYPVHVIEPFIASSRIAGYTGELRLGVLASQWKSVAHLGSRFNVTFVAVDPDHTTTIALQRMKIYMSWCNALPRDAWVLTVDVRDSFMQRDLFSIEYMRQIDAPINLFYEAATIKLGEEPTNSGWIRSCWGERSVPFVTGKQVICSGSIFGRVTELLELLADYEMLAATVPHCRDIHGIDQGILNYLAHLRHWDTSASVKIWPQGAGPVNTIGWDASIINWRDGLVHDANGRVSAFVHQYDRHGHISATYNNFVRQRAKQHDTLTRHFNRIYRN